MSCSTRVAVVGLCLLHASNSVAWVRQFSAPNCPDYNKNVSWHDYISAQVEPNPEFTVVFKMAKQVADPEAIGHLATNLCYTEIYSSTPWWVWPQGFFSSAVPWVDPNRKTTKNDPKVPAYKAGPPGDPNEYEINVYGVILQYTDAGTVLDKRGRPVGLLLCILTDECGQY